MNTSEITPEQVKQLRQHTGAGIINCRRALQESNGDITKAQEWLRQQNITKGNFSLETIREKPAEGLVASYIHTGGRVGVLVEVHCESDFVSRNEKFKELVQNIALQIAASPQIPGDLIAKEREVEQGRSDLEGKPESVKEKIVAGRVGKLLKEITLLHQPFVKNPEITIAELIAQHCTLFGEKIVVKRFVRFGLGEVE